MSAITLSREELYKQVWTITLSSLANKYMRTEISLRILCISMSIPVPRDGHWHKIRAGQKIDMPPLSSNYDGPASIKLSMRDPKKKPTATKEEKQHEPVVKMPAVQKKKNRKSWRQLLAINLWTN